MQERVVIRTDRAGPRMPAAAKDAAYSVAQVESIARGQGEPGWLADRRREALRLYREIPLPAASDEAWRRTDLAGLRLDELDLNALGVPGRTKRPPADLLKPLLGKAHGGQVVFGDLDPAVTPLAPALAAQGVIFLPFSEAARTQGDLVQRYLGQVVNPAEGKFAAWVAALGDVGAFAYVPKGVQAELPLHSVCWTTPSGLRGWRLLVVVDEGATLTYVHENASPAGSEASLRAGVVELIAHKGSTLRFVEFQSWGANVWNITHERAQVHEGATLEWIFGGTGSRLTKTFTTLDLLGSGATGRMSGFYFADGDQHLDHDTQQNHQAPHTTSDLLFKGALKGHSRSVWQGMIFVAHGAEKADGYQANRNLILSKHARADSLPGLEILADDVRCTHGATVGQLDEDEVFYLMTRGVPRPEAERVVVDGFFDTIMQRIPFEGVRRRLRSAVDAKMGASVRG
ncbi:MAG TPA: Fe-S cluster assembly protein SufD [Anaerolineales bacterium]|nr:Fe-S cluster assembly protein SufD [Anaerolineales bacterium]